MTTTWHFFQPTFTLSSLVEAVFAILQDLLGIGLVRMVM